MTDERGSVDPTSREAGAINVLGFFDPEAGKDPQPGNSDCVGAGIVVVGPRLESMGGIAAVNRIYQSLGTVEADVPHPGFDSDEQRLEGQRGNCGARYFPSACDGDKLTKLVYSFKQILTFAARTPSELRGVHLHVSTGVSFVRKCAYLWLARRVRARIIFHIHPSSFWEYARAGGPHRRRMVRWALRNAHLVIVLTQSAAKRAAEWVPEDRIAILPNPVDSRALRIDPPPSRRHDLILFLGWYVEAKGVFDLVKAIERLRQHHPGLRAVFGGCKETDRLKRVVETLGLEQMIQVRGWLDRDEVKSLLHSCTVLALPSYTEGIPMVILEGMACGTPIVTCAVGGIPDIIREGRNALYVQPGDIAGLTEALHLVLVDPSLRNRMSQNNVVDSLKFDAKALKSRLDQIYRRILEEPHTTERGHASD